MLQMMAKTRRYRPGMIERAGAMAKAMRTKEQ
jgi:hypothetical protein